MISKYISKKSKVVILSLIMMIALYIFHTKNFDNSVENGIEKCTSFIKEDEIKHGLNAEYQQIISVSNNHGFVKKYGWVTQGDKRFYLRRSYTFDLKKISKDNYKLSIIKISKAHNDNLPQEVFIKLWPEKYRLFHILKIQEISDDVFLFSGLEFPLFTCKAEKK